MKFHQTHREVPKITQSVSLILHSASIDAITLNDWPLVMARHEKLPETGVITRVTICPSVIPDVGTDLLAMCQRNVALNRHLAATGGEGWEQGVGVKWGPPSRPSVGGSFPSHQMKGRCQVFPWCNTASAHRWPALTLRSLPDIPGLTDMRSAPLLCIRLPH